jgi:septal ring factor EnvC (AmiA/AmiB activator)
VRGKGAYPLAGALALLLGCALAPAAAQERDRTQTREELKQVQSAIAALSKERAEALKKREQLLSKLQEAETALGRIRRTQRQLAEELTATEAQLAQLEDRQRSLGEALEAQRMRIAEGMLASYRVQREGRLRLVLDPPQADNLARMLAYHRYLHAARQAEIQQYRELQDKIAALAPELQKTRATLTAQQTAQQTEAAALAAANTERSTVLTALAQTIENREADIASLQQDQQALEALLQRLEATQASAPRVDPSLRFADRRGKLAWPVQGELETRFGAPRSDGRVRWQGVRLTAERGSTVRAVHSGRVIFADWLRGSGLLLILDHGEGYMSLYANNDTLLRDVGDTVAAGAPVSTVGTSGGNERPALYFEIRHNGKPQDPARWCST